MIGSKFGCRISHFLEQRRLAYNGEFPIYCMGGRSPSRWVLLKHFINFQISTIIPFLKFTSFSSELIPLSQKFDVSYVIKCFQFQFKAEALRLRNVGPGL